MGILDRLKSTVQATSGTPAGQAGAEAPPAPSPGDPESALRQTLAADPNDAEAFAALAEIVRRRAVEDAPLDPLTAAPAADRRRAADLAVWALAEELAGNARGWYPLIEMARLSLNDDHEGALRRLAGACERDSSGRAVAEGVRMLRKAGLPGEALGLGVGHWSPQEHIPDAGRNIVLAALDAGRPTEARRHLEALVSVARPHAARAKEIRAELEPVVAAAEEMARTTSVTETGTVPAVVVARRSGSLAPPAPVLPSGPPGPSA